MKRDRRRDGVKKLVKSRLKNFVIVYSVCIAILIALSILIKGDFTWVDAICGTIGCIIGNTIGYIVSLRKSKCQWESL